MKNVSFFIAVALAASHGGYALASEATSSKSREQVKAELAEAIRTGDIVVISRRGLKANQVAPHLYPAPAAEPVKSREAINAELNEAITSGDVVVSSRKGLKANQIRPDLYPAKPVVEGKTRQQVIEERDLAISRGELLNRHRGGGSLFTRVSAQ